MISKSIFETLKSQQPTHKWSGSFDEVGYEIQRWWPKYPVNTGDGSVWYYYVYISLDSVEDKEAAKSLWLKAKKSKYNMYLYHYYDNPILKEIEFAGGMTWYSKHFDREDKKVIQVGCDYNHIWDDGVFQTLETVLTDIKMTIDSVYENIPSYKATQRKLEAEQLTASEQRETEGNDTANPGLRSEQ